MKRLECDVLVAGSAVFHSGDPERATRDLKAGARNVLI